jgi:hypothetical protein
LHPCCEHALAYCGKPLPHRLLVQRVLSERPGEPSVGSLELVLDVLQLTLLIGG